MSDTLIYSNLALEWSPDKKADHNFNKIAVIALVVTLLVGLFIAGIELPKEERRVKPAVPERVAQFIMEKEKPEVKPEPKPEKLPKPIIPKTLKKRPEIQKALTKAEKKARKKAESSGLLALSSELTDLMDTESISAMVGVKTKRSNGSTQAATHHRDVLSDVGKGSGGVDASRYTASRSTTKLSQREITLVKQSLLTGKAAGGTDKSASSKNASSKQTGRSEAELTVVFDRYKGSLYSVYNRARRKNPGLSGKIVLEITIAPGGKVTAVRIVSSELGDAELEKSLLRRIRGFDFGKKDVEPITVTYPIEFLPS
jgi:TonB family protein